MNNIQTSHSVEVVIPIYKIFEELTIFEKVSLDRCVNILSSHGFTFVCPDNLDVGDYTNYLPKARFEKFSSFYFQDIKSYNSLMLNQEFYQRFVDLDYILIYQLDAMVFDDQLQYWCSQGYDYIGAPWLTTKFDGNTIVASYKKWKSQVSYKKNKKYKKSNIPYKEQFYNKVGNGGFSLRNPQKMIFVLNELKEEVKYYLDNGDHSFYNEDAFWSLEANRVKKRLNIPDFKTAVFFSVEFFPEEAFKLTSGRFPFGCHDWDSYVCFWIPKFLEMGINIESA